MRTNTIAIVICCFIFSLLVAQDVQIDEGREIPTPNYLLEVIELDLTPSDTGSKKPHLHLDVDTIVRESKKNGTSRHRRILKLAAVDGIESYAQFAERVPTVIGETVRQNESSFTFEDTNVGTELRATVVAKGDEHVHVNLSLASSDVSLTQNGWKGHVWSVTGNCSKSVKLGLPTLLETSSQGKTSAIIFTVSKPVTPNTVP